MNTQNANVRNGRVGGRFGPERRGGVGRPPCRRGSRERSSDPESCRDLTVSLLLQNAREGRLRYLWAASNRSRPENLRRPSDPRSLAEPPPRGTAASGGGGLVFSDLPNYRCTEYSYGRRGLTAPFVTWVDHLGTRAGSEPPPRPPAGVS